MTNITGRTLANLLRLFATNSVVTDDASLLQYASTSISILPSYSYCLLTDTTRSYDSLLNSIHHSTHVLLTDEPLSTLGTSLSLNPDRIIFKRD